MTTVQEIEKAVAQLSRNHKCQLKRYWFPRPAWEPPGRALRALWTQSVPSAIPRGAWNEIALKLTGMIAQRSNPFP